MKQLFVQSVDTGEQQEILDLDVAPSLKVGTDGKKELSFTIELTYDNQLAFNLLTETNVLIVDEKTFGAQRYFITDVEKEQVDESLTKVITAHHMYTMRLNNHFVNEELSGRLSLSKALSHALSGSGFRYDISSDAANISSVVQENFGNKNGIELMDEIVEDYKIELAIDNDMIYVHKKLGQARNFKLDTRYNIEGITIKSSSQSITTRAWGFGKKDEDTGKYAFEPFQYVHPDENYFLLDGRPRYAPSIVDDRYTSKSSMEAALKELVNPYPQITISVTPLAFYDPLLDGREDEFDIGDSINVIADTLIAGTTYEDTVRIVEMTYNPLDPYDAPELTLANVSKSVLDMQVEEMLRIRNQENYIQSRTNEIRREISSDMTTTTQVLEAATYVDFTKLSPELYARLNLAHSTVMQSFNIDRVNNQIYATQVWNGEGKNPNMESFVITRMDLSGKMLDYMVCLEGGHGTNIGLEWAATEGKMYIWSHYYTSDVTRTHTIARFPYQPGASIRYNDASIQRTKNLGGEEYTVVSLDIEHNLLFFRRDNKVIAQDLESARNDVLKTVDEMTIDLPSGTIFQGAYMDYPYVYWYTGDANQATDPNMLRVYDIRGNTTIYEKRIIFAKNTAISWENDFREPEGVYVYVDPNTKTRTVMTGYATGLSGARIAKIYAYREPSEKINTSASFNTDLYANDDATKKLRAVTQTLIIEYNGTTWEVSKASRYVATQQNLVTGVTISGNDLRVAFNEKYYSLLHAQVEADINLKAANILVGTDLNPGGDTSNILTLGFARNGSRIAPNSTYVVAGSKISVLLMTANPSD
ncbi:phage tail protein [Bacillus spizizenii]|nr:phage tail protein [Bacillus spizizenii]